MGMDRIVANVFETREYDKFKKLLGNRDVTEQRVQKIMNSIKNAGYVLCPCVVNGKNEIIDGQGRIEALKRLNMPVHYVVDKNAGLEQCVQLNINGTPWNQMDYIQSYVTQGNQNYINFLELIELFPDINIDVIAYAITGKVEAKSIASQGKLGSRNRIAAGMFVCTEEQKQDAYNKLIYLSKFVPIIKSTSKKGSPIYFLKAVLFAIYYAMADQEQMYHKCFTYQQNMLPFHNMREALVSISNLYNYRSKKKNIDFELLYRARNEEIQVYVNKYGKAEKEAV